MCCDINKGRLLGAHCSIAGGLYKAAETGGVLGCNVIQIFTKSSNQWKATPLTLEQIDRFKDACGENGIKVVVAHTGYLINLATSDSSVHDHSMESMRIELERAESLEIPYLVLHPGSHKEAGEVAGIMQVVESLRRLREEFKGARTQIVLETTAGQGSYLGYKFEHFAEILDQLDWPPDIGICVDTAHIFQAGYDIRTKKGYGDVMKEFDEIVGLDYIRCFHVNDSKTALGARSDRHEGLGKGHIGKDAFGFLIKDRRFKKIPMLLETPKGSDSESDKKNLNILRKFAG